MFEPIWLVIPLIVVVWFAFESLKAKHYNNPRWKFTMSKDNLFRAILIRKKTHTDPDFIDFGRKDGKRIARWGRIITDRFGETIEEKVEVEIPWSLIYPDIETLRRLVIYPWVEEKVARQEFDLTPKKWLFHHGPWLYDWTEGLTHGESFYLAFPEWIAEAREKLKEIARHKKMADYERF